MRKVLVLLASSYPFGGDEAFLAHEMPHLASAFDEIVVLSNDTETPEARPLPPRAAVQRHPWALGPAERAGSALGLLSPMVWDELGRVRRSPALAPGGGALHVALVSRARAEKFARILRRVAARFPGAEVHAYSYWASDMALAAALARRRGWVDRACCRAHGWDVYPERTGYLPFRHVLATHLDHYLFVSEDGRRRFDALMGRSYPSVGVARLGTPSLAPAATARLRPFTVVSCGTLIPLKRVELIAAALARVTVPTRWIHVGDGPSREAVQAACASLPAHVTAELRGALPNARVMELLAGGEVSLLLNVSRTEGLPVTMMEAMSAGVPVMGTAVGGVAEIVRPGVNGVILPADPAPADVAAALDAFASLTEEEHGALARGAWETWDADFNAERNYASFLRLIGA